MSMKTETPISDRRRDAATLAQLREIGEDFFRWELENPGNQQAHPVTLNHLRQEYSR